MQLYRDTESLVVNWLSGADRDRGGHGPAQLHAVGVCWYSRRCPSAAATACRLAGCRTRRICAEAWASGGYALRSHPPRQQHPKEGVRHRLNRKARALRGLWRESSITMRYQALEYNVFIVYHCRSCLSPLDLRVFVVSVTGTRRTAGRRAHSAHVADHRRRARHFGAAHERLLVLSQVRLHLPAAVLACGARESGAG